MDLKLNDSEIMQLLTYIDDASGYDLEPMERATFLSITNKINNQVQYKHHNFIDNFCVDVRSVLLEEAD